MATDPNEIYKRALWQAPDAIEPAAASDPYEDIIRRQRDDEISFRVRTADPDAMGRAHRIARERNLPVPIVLGNLPSFEKEGRVARARAAMQEYPALGAWSARGGNASIAADDFDNLSLFGKAFYGLKNVGRALEAGAYTALGGIYGALGGLAENLAPISPETRAVFDPIADFLLGIQKSDKAAADAARPRIENWWARNLAQGVESVPTSLAAVGVGMLGSPGAGAAVLGVSVGGNEYASAREAGLSPARSALYGATQGGIETLTERIPVSRLVGDLAAKSPLAKTLLRQIAAEIPSEQAATLLQDMNEWATLHPEKSVAQFMAERPQAAAETLLATVGGVGGTVGVTTATERTVRVATQVADRHREAVRARAGSAFLDGIADATGKAKTTTRAPDALVDLVQALGEETGADRVFIPADALQAYEQSDSYSGEYDGFRDAVDEAYATGGDVALPIGELTRLAGTPAWAALRDDMRLSVSGMSVREATAFEDAMADVTAELSDQIAERHAAEAQAREPREKLFQAVSDKLMDAGFTPSMARQQAELLTQRMSTRAARMGQELTGAEFDGIAVNRVLPPALAAAQKVDQVDMTIDVMKRGLDPKRPGSLSLLEYISKGGGIEDPGGDLRAMDAQRWHIGKPGKRKLIRETAADQPALISDGGPGKNSLTPDEWAFRAWEAGYFPEFGEERPGINDLFEAIDAELRGTPRFNEVHDKGLRDAAEELRAMLENAGIDPATASRRDIRAAVDRYVAEQAQGLGYDQSESGPKGRITFPGGYDGRAIIDLFESADQSTFIHETSHLWLEELRFDAADPNAPQQLRDDWQTVQDWFAANGHPIVDGAIPVEAHEMWARAGEQYLMEGKAPSLGLRRMFQTFKAWMISVYHTVSRLNVPMTDEIRAVMDRLVATDEELADAIAAQHIEALFPEKPDTMTDGEYAAYREQTDNAVGAARDALLNKVMNGVRRRVTKEYRERAAEVRADVEASIDARPEFRAIRQLRETPLDANWLRDFYGEEALAMLPKQVPPIYRDGGANPDEVAELSGFTSGDEMVRTLMGVETRRRELREGGDQRSVRKALIDQEVDRIMMERYGDPLTDGTIEEEALAAVHSDQQGEVIAAEMRVLARSTGQRVTPYRIAKEWAARAVREGTVNDVASRGAIRRHERAAAKAGKAAMEAVIAGDRIEAFRQKQAQMLNNALVAEARNAADDVDSAVKRLEKWAKRRTAKSVDQDYLERAQALLEQVDMKPRSQRFIDRRDSFEAWAEAQEALGHDIVVPRSFAASLGTTHWSRLTVDQLTALDEAVKQIIHLGRLKQTLLDNKEQRDFEAVVNEALDGMGDMKRKPPVTGFTEPGYFDRTKQFVLDVDASMLKAETILQWLDDGREGGTFTRVAFQPFVEAQEQRRLRTIEIYDRLEAARQKIPEKIREGWQRRVTLNFIDPETGAPAVMEREKLIAMALNQGNADNARKVAAGYGWSETAIADMLNQHLTPEEWTYVQDVWDTLQTLWPDIAALERRVNGVEPEAVQARELTTSAGVLRGGYYPLVYDPTRSVDADKHASDAGGKLFETAYRRATTRAGATNERVDVTRPVLLSLSVLSRHVGEVVHDITHREAVMNAYKFLNDRRVVRAIDETLGPEIRKQLNPWLQHIANEFAIDATGTAALEKFVKGLRANATFVGMAYRYSTAAMQAAGLGNTAERVGARAVADGVYRFAKAPVETTNFVLATSREVAGRMSNLDRDVRDAIKREQSKFGPLSRVKEFGFHMIGLVDRFVAVTSWIGAYNKGLTGGMDDGAAVAYADRVIRQSQGAGAAKDLAAIQRGRGPAGEASKLLTMFYSYMSAFYQRQRTLNRDAGKAIRQRDMGKLPELLARTMWLYFFPALASELLAGRGPEDDEDWAWWAAERIGLAALGPIPVVRDIAGGIASGFGYTFTPASGLGRTVTNILKDGARIWEGEETKRATRDVMEGLGYLGAPVSGQMAASTQFLVDVASGDQHPETFGEWWEGLTKGKVAD